MTASDSSIGIRWRLAGALGALGLLVAVLVTAGPDNVWRLVRRTDLSALAPAVACLGVALACRGVRLVMLLDRGRLGAGPAILVAAASQAAALLVPARVGELALPLLLRRVAGCAFADGVGTLLAARTLDVATLGVWAGAALIGVRGATDPATVAAALALLLPPALLPLTLRAADRLATRCLAPRGLGWRRWARRVRRTRRAVGALAARPGRLVVAVAASLAMWAAVWAQVWFLLAAAGYRWPPLVVAAGSAVASLANLLPINLFANLGTLEAGWTAGFSALGVATATAAATGLYCHLWALVLSAAYGAAAWALLSATTRLGGP